MTTLTLEAIQAKQDELAELIAKFKVQTSAPTGPTTLVVPEAYIELQPGERYAGAVIDGDGLISHHLVLLPGQADSVNWQAAKAWAAERGATLPNRQEQALLYANLKGCFEANWYWSCEVHEDDGAYAWDQDFDYGYQDIYRQSSDGRARAVRRVTA